MKRFIQFIFLAGLTLFFLATRPGNHSEADVAFENATAVERPDVVPPPAADQALYRAAARGLWLTLRAAGLPVRAHELLVVLSSLFAAGTAIVFFRFCFRHFSLRPLSSLLASGLLVFSYGYWRYAVEATTIMPAAFFMLWAAYRTPETDTAKRCVATGFLAGVALLLSLFNVPGVLVVIPVYFLLTRRFRPAFWYALGCLVTVAGGLAGLRAAGFDWYWPGHLWTPEGQGWSAPVKGAVGLGQSLVSANFLLGWADFREWLAGLFPYRNFREEFFLGQRLSAAERIVPALTYAVLLLTTAIALWRSAASRREGRGRTDSKGSGETRGGDGVLGSSGLRGGRRSLLAAGFWFAAYALMILRTQPGNPEVWVLGLIPFWLTVCGLIVVPLARTRTLWPVLLALAALGIHNYAGGLHVVARADRDYNRARASWVADNAGPDDLVVTGDSEVFQRYLQYVCRGRVLSADRHDPDRVRALRPTGTAGRIFLVEDAAGNRMEAWRRATERNVRAVHVDDLVRVLEWTPPPEDPSKEVDSGAADAP